MEIRRNAIYLALACSLISACISVEKEQDTTTKIYFDLAGYVQEKIEELEAISNVETTAPLVYRVISMGEQKEDISFTKKDSKEYPSWQKELLLFKEADINKPVLLQAYEITKTDSSEVYTAKEENLKVRKIEIVFDDKEVGKIDITLREKNYLFSSTKSMYLLVKNGLIQTYAVDGQKKLVANKALNYDVVTQLVYP